MKSHITTSNEINTHTGRGARDIRETSLRAEIQALRAKGGALLQSEAERLRALWEEFGTLTGAGLLSAEIQALRAEQEKGRKLSASDRERLQVCADTLARIVAGVGAMDEVETLAGRIAGQRARFASLGSAALFIGDDRVTHRQASALRLASLASGGGEGPAVAVQLREGSGRAVDWQAVAEMKLAARAALLAGFGALPAGMEAANRAASHELHRSTKEQHFGDIETATRAQDRAYRVASEQWKADEGAEAARIVQPHRAEMISAGDSEARCWRRTLRGAARRAAASLAAYWSAGGLSGTRLRGFREDRRTIAGLLRSIRNATACFPSKAANEAQFKRLSRLADRRKRGASALAMGLLCDPSPRRLPVVTADTTPRPFSPVETWEARAIGDPVPSSVWIRTPYAERLIARQPATAGDLATLRDWRPAMS